MTNLLIFLAGAAVGIGVYANWAKIAPAIVALKDKIKPKSGGGTGEENPPKK
jgi:hypothetical protein